MSDYTPTHDVLTRTVRDDAVPLANPPRYYVPTTDATRWIGTWGEFVAAGGTACYAEDQTYVLLTVPAPYKIGIDFTRSLAKTEA